MKALTIYQPWASLIMVGAKPFEFRGWDFTARDRNLAGQRIVVHASARLVRPKEVDDLLARLGGEGDMTGLDVDKARALLLRVRAAYKCQLLPLAAALGTAKIGKPKNAGVIFGAKVADSDRGVFNFAWPMSEVKPFAAPIPMRGMQGFWNCDVKEAA